jgi:hypothetical protein
MMKKIKIIFMLCLFALGFTSCEEDSDSLTGNENTGGLISVENKLVGYVVGDGQDTEYKVKLSVFQSIEKVKTVNVYKTFYTVQQEVKAGIPQVDKDGKPVMVAVKSNEVLFRTLTFPMASQHEEVTFTSTFNELSEGLTVEYYTPGPISSSDTETNIGDYWGLRYETITASGKKQQTNLKNNATKVAVGTRYAGTYKCNEGVFYRGDALGYSTGDWPKETIIESVDAVTYRVKTYFGPYDSASFDNNEWYFKVDSNGIITYPAFEPDGVTPNQVNGLTIESCGSDPRWELYGKCSTSNVIVKDDVNKKDKLRMTLGYTTSAVRVLFQELQKI